MKQHSIFIWLPPLLKRIYKPSRTSLDFDYLCLWPFRRLQASWFSTLCVSVSSTTSWFLYLHHNLIVQCNCLAQWGPQWEPQGISIVRITNNRKEEEQKKKHHEYKNRSKLHQTEEFQNSGLFKTGNRSMFERLRHCLLSRAAMCIYKESWHALYALLLLLEHIKWQYSEILETVWCLASSQPHITFCFVVFFPILVF